MNQYCTGCGQPLASENRFCPACGQSVQPTDDPEAPDPCAQSLDDDGALYWSAEFPMVTNRFFLRDMGKFLSLLFLVLAVVTVLMGVAAGNDLSFTLTLLPLWGVAVLGFGVFALVVSLVVLGNRSGALYRMDDEGLAVLNRSKATPLNEVSQWLGILTGSGQLWASGVLAQAQEKVYLRWRSVHGFRLYPGDGVIEFDDAFHTALRIYCPAEVYAKVAARLQSNPIPSAGKSKGILAILGWLTACVIATLLGLCWEPKVNDVGFMVVLTGMFVFLSGLLPGMLHRGLGLFGLLSGAVALIHRASHLIEPRVWSTDYKFWPASFATLGCSLLVGLSLYQMFRKDRPGQEMVMFDEDLAD